MVIEEIKYYNKVENAEILVAHYAINPWIWIWFWVPFVGLVIIFMYYTSMKNNIAYMATQRGGTPYTRICKSSEI